MEAEALRVDARSMGAAFEGDAELSLPHRPCLIPELVLAPTGDGGIVVTGGVSTEVLRGRGVGELLVPLLSLLDGTRDLVELAALLPGFARQELSDAIALLFSRGLLQDGAIHPVSAEQADLAAFLGRHVDATRVNRSREEALARLAQAPVALVGDRRLTGIVGAQLQASGLRVVDGNMVDSSERCQPAYAVVVSTGDAPVSAAEIEHAIRSCGACLLVRLGSSEVHVGPVLVEGATICPACLAKSAPHPEGRPTDVAAELWLSIASQLAVLEVSRVGSGTAIHRGWMRYAAAQESGASTMAIAARVPGCPTCQIDGAAWEPDDDRMLAWNYHVGSSVSRRSAIGMREHQRHYLAANITLAEARDELLYSRTSVTLDRVGLDEMIDHADNSHRHPTIQDLAAVLARSAGRSATYPHRRIAPTGGNLGSVRIWVVAHRVAGLSPGTYLYEPHDHSLRLYGTVDDGALSTYFGSPHAANDPLPDCLLIGAANLAKCIQKYDAFAYRLVHLDAGVALAYLHTVCGVRGLDVTEYPNLDLAVADSFGVPRRWEYPLPTFAVALGPASRTGTLHSTRPATDPPVVGHHDLVIAMVNATRRPPDDRGTSAAVSSAPAVPLFAASSEHLESALSQRRATRTFARDSLTYDEIKRLTKAATTLMDARARAGAANTSVRPVVLVPRGGPSLPAGTYDVAPDGGLMRRSSFSPAQAWESCLQGGLAQAPAALVMVANLRGALTDRGARGYCDVVMQAGAAVGGAWIAATLDELVGTAAGGVLADGLRSAAGMDGFNECPLLAFHVGRSARGDE